MTLYFLSLLILFLHFEFFKTEANSQVNFRVQKEIMKYFILPNHSIVCCWGECLGLHYCQDGYSPHLTEMHINYPGTLEIYLKLGGKIYSLVCKYARRIVVKQRPAVLRPVLCAKQSASSRLMDSRTGLKNTTWYFWPVGHKCHFTPFRSVFSSFSDKLGRVVPLCIDILLF